MSLDPSTSRGGGNITLPVSVADGGTGATTAAGARAALAVGAPVLPSGLAQLLTMPINTTQTLTLNRECVFGVNLAAQTIAQLGISVRIAGDASAVVRIGVRDNLDGYPGAPTVDTTIAATSTGWKSATIDYDHPGGVLWFSYTGQGWSATAIVLDVASSFGPISAALLGSPGWATGHTPVVGYQTGVSGALPSTFTNANGNTLAPVTLFGVGA